MDIDDITASLGAGSLRDSLRGPRQPVGTFSTPRPLNLDEHWQNAQIRAALRPATGSMVPRVRAPVWIRRPVTWSWLLTKR
jgi:hypothetical protein